MNSLGISARLSAAWETAKDVLHGITHPQESLMEILDEEASARRAAVLDLSNGRSPEDGPFDGTTNE